jgi:hypothetical protein
VVPVRTGRMSAVRMMIQAVTEGGKTFPAETVASLAGQTLTVAGCLLRIDEAAVLPGGTVALLRAELTACAAPVPA